MAVQPLSPRGHDEEGNPVEGKDPLAQGKTLYPREDTKAESEKLEKSDDAVAQQNLEDQAADASNSDGHDTTENPDGVTPDEKGTLPADSKVANKVGSDKGNTSPSNKPATPDAESAETAPAKVSPIDGEKAAQNTDTSSTPKATK